MGVKGLSTFVDDHPDLLTNLELHNTKVVVDGNNLIHFLYKTNCTCGGDYNVYASEVTRYFKILLSVGVEPHVLLDGCFEDQKFPTILQRMQNRINVSHCLSKGGSGSLLPLMAHQVFRDVLQSLGISHWMCEWEADGECAALANQLQCPVMSGDSDFYIYDLSHGFIHFNNLDLDYVASGKDKNRLEYKYLRAQVYFLDNLLKHYNKLTRESIPLFATIMGNDFVEHNYFKDFISSTMKSLNTLGERQVSKVEQVLACMDYYKEDFVTKILEYITEEKKGHVKAMIDDSMEMYTKIAESCKVGEYQSASIQSAAQAESSWRTLGGNPFPSWFVSLAKKGRIAFLNALVLGKVLMPCQVELKHLPSAMACCGPLRQVIYSILLGYDANTNNDLDVKEYLRNDSKIDENNVHIVRQMDGIDIPTMIQLQSMSNTDKEEFLFSCLGTTPEILSDIPKDIKIFVALLMFFVSIAEPTTSPAFIHSVVLSFIKLSVIDQDPESNRLKGFTLQDIHKVKDRLWQCYRTIARPFMGEFVHTLSQLKSCWWAVTQLCEILELDTKLQSPAIAINGTLIYHLHTVLEARTEPLNGSRGYHLHTALENRTEPLNCIDNILEGCPSVRTYFDLISQKILGKGDQHSP